MKQFAKIFNPSEDQTQVGDRDVLFDVEELEK